MTCREVMTPDPVCCRPDESAVQIARMMQQENIGSVPVCESDGKRKLRGIVTDRDIALKVVGEGRDPNRTKAKDVMTSNPVACNGDDDLQSALDAMERRQIRRIPVVDENDELIGIIAQADVAVRVGEPQLTAEVVEKISRPRLHV